MTQDEPKIHNGTLRRVPRAHWKWSWEWRYIDPGTGERQSKYLPSEELPTESDVSKHMAPFIERLNTARIRKLVIVDPTVGDLLDRDIAEERLLEIKNRKPGERAPGKDELAYSTAISYLSLCNRIRKAWGSTKLDKFKPLAFRNWLKDLVAKPNAKGHLKAFVHRLFNLAKLYEMLDYHENPIALVEVRGISKRSRKPADLTIEQFFQIHDMLPEPYSRMTLVALCSGTRVEELLALMWTAIDFDRLCMKVKEAVVHGRIGPVKSEYSEDELPLDPGFASILLDAKLQSRGSPLVFPSPVTGRSYHASPIQQDCIRRAGWCLVECPKCGAKPGVACVLESKGRGKQFNIPVHDAAAIWLLRTVSVVSAGTRSGTPTGRCTANSRPLSRSSRPCCATRISRLRCSMAGRRWKTGGKRTATWYERFSFADRRSEHQKANRAP
jgi:integrase